MAPPVSEADAPAARVSPDERRRLARELLRDGRRLRSLPLSLAQERLWFLCQLHPASPFYNQPTAIRLRGPLRVNALEASLSGVLRRHEALRASFESINGRAIQRFWPEVAVGLEVVDLTAIPSEERESRLPEQLTVRTRALFDLAVPPLLRAVLFRVAADDHVLLLVAHHIVTDGWSMGVLLRDLSALYNASVSGVDPELRELGHGYVDYVARQRAWMQGPAVKQEVAYWQRQLQDAPTIIQFPTDRRRPAMPSHEGAVVGFEVEGQLVRTLNHFAIAAHGSLFMALLAGFFVLLQRYSGQSEMLIGTPAANRDPDMQDVIGYFANTVVLRGDLSGDPSFRALFGRVREMALGAYEHQRLPLEKLLDELRPERSLSRTPIYQTSIALHESPLTGIHLKGLKLEHVVVDPHISKFDLSISATLGDGGLQVCCEYSTDLFLDRTVRALCRHYSNLLRTAVSAPETRVSRLAMLDAAERSHLIAGWAPPRSRPQREARPTCLHRLFERQAARAPDATALTCGGHAVTYAQLNQRANRLARSLRQLGVGPEVKVGLCMERSSLSVEAILAILKAGGAYLPLDPEYPAQRLTFMLADARARLVLSDQSSKSRLPPLPVEVITLTEGDAQPTHERDVENLVGGAHADDLAYIIYTSGSTGTPKGVMVSHANVSRLLRKTQPWFRFASTDVWTLFHSMSFDFSVWEIWGSLAHGGRLVVVPWLVTRSPNDFAELLRKEEVTVLNQTPSAFRQLSRVILQDDRTDRLRLRTVIFGGEALELEALRPWLDRFGDRQPELFNMYGITETTVHVTGRRLRRTDLDSEPVSPIGEAIPDLQLHILDDNLEPVPLGVAGEIYVGGPGLARGYHSRPTLTAERFVPDPFETDGGRLYRTGDLGRRLSDGDVEYVGRADEQVKIRGFRIELGEIQSALAAHPAVAENVVVATAVPGEERRLVAYLVPRRERSIAIEELRRFLRSRLPDHMVPAAFVLLEQLPQTVHGKIDRRALPSPGAQRPDLAYPPEPPTSPVESVLVAIWAEVLGLEQVGIRDNFFALGGDSIRTIQVVARARQRNVDLHVQDLFTHQTVAELAEHVEVRLGVKEARPAAAFELIAETDRAQLPSGLSDAYPLTRLQAGMLFHSEYAPGEHAYHNIETLRVQAPLEPRLLKEALAQLSERHATLRTSFELAQFTEPLQLVHSALKIPLAVHDLRHLPGPAQEEHLSRWLDAEKGHAFDWGSAPLLRLSVHLLGGETLQLSLTHHHAILDGWSVATFLTELVERTLALSRGERPDTAAPPFEFRDLVALELEALATTRHGDFWVDRLAGASPTLLPRWPPVASDADRAGHVHVIRLEESVGRELIAVARRANLPLKSVLLAAHMRVLALMTGESDVTTGLICGVRPEAAGSEEALGLFLNTIPFRLRVMDGSWLELAQLAFHEERQLLPHVRYPLAEIQRLVGGRAPFETAFNYVHFHVYGRLQSLPGVRLVGQGGFQKTNLTCTANFVLEDGPALTLHLEADPLQLGPTQVRQLADYYLRVVEDIAAEPDRQRFGAGLLLPAERVKVTEKWSRTHAEVPPAVAAHQLVEAQAGSTPMAPAVRTASEQLTYGELNERANHLAHLLLQAGIGPDTVVGLLLPRSPAFIVSMLAVLKVGAAYLPLDPAYPDEHLAFLVKDARAELVITESRFLNGWLAHHSIRVLPFDELQLPLRGGASRDPFVSLHPDNLAYVLYTSGSTGQPKGVMITHRGLGNYLNWAARNYDVGAGWGTIVHSPVTFDLTVTSLWLPLVVGRTVELLPEGGGVDELAGLLRGRRGASLLKITPAHLDLLLFELGQDALVGRSRVVVIGGEALIGESLLGWQPAARSGTRFVNEYGPTETVVGCIVQEVSPLECGHGPVPIGQPIANTTVRILRDGQDPVPVGTPAELCIGGLGLARGYVGRPDLTAASFVPDPFADEPGARLYRTGDLARFLPDGIIEFLGRTDRQVKIRGFRVEPGEVEAALLRHPGVREACVIAEDDRTGNKRLIAFVVPRTSSLSSAELQSSARRLLPPQQVPSSYVMLESLPLTSNGKVDVSALPRGEVIGRKPYRPPHAGLEQSIADIFSEVLGLQPIGRDDDFFELGGHSLPALRAISRMRANFPIELTVRALFDAPTVASLAQAVQELLLQQLESMTDADAQALLDGGGQAVPSERRR